jgi:hypothetical protein
MSPEVFNCVRLADLHKGLMEGVCELLRIRLREIEIQEDRHELFMQSLPTRLSS